MVLSVLSVLSIVSVASSGQTLQFSLTDLGAFGGASSDAKDVDIYGNVVGYYTTSSGQLNCFYYHNSTILGSSVWKSPHPGGTCIVYGINRSGVMAGTITASNGNASAFTATRNLRGQVNVTYLSSPYGLSTYGAGISDQGTVFGSSYDGPTTYRASTWINGTYSQVAADTSWLTTYWQDCTTCTYFANYSQTISWQTRSYECYGGNGEYACVEALPLSAINVNSQINAFDHNSGYVGWSVGDDGTSHAVQWSWASSAQDVAGPNSFATGMSLDFYGSPPNPHLIIGQWQGGAVPFLRQTNEITCTQTVNLQTLLDSTGSGWTLLEANRMNTPDGVSYYIVGSARNSLGQTHAVRLTSNGGTLCP